MVNGNEFSVADKVAKNVSTVGSNKPRIFSIDDISEYSPELFFKAEKLDPSDFHAKFLQKGYFWSYDRIIISYCGNPEVQKFYAELAAGAKKNLAFMIRDDFPTALALINFRSVSTVKERPYEKWVDGEQKIMSNVSFFYELSGTLLIPKRPDFHFQKKIDFDSKKSIEQIGSNYSKGSNN